MESTTCKTCLGYKKCKFEDNLLQLFIRQREFLLRKILGGINHRFEMFCQRGDNVLQNKNSAMVSQAGSIPSP